MQGWWQLQFSWRPCCHGKSSRTLLVPKVGGVHHSDGCPVVVLFTMAELADVGLVWREKGASQRENPRSRHNIPLESSAKCRLMNVCENTT